MWKKFLMAFVLTAAVFAGFGGAANVSALEDDSQSSTEQGEHVHNYSSQVTLQPTCTKEGTLTFSCSCTDSYTQSIAPTGHDYVSKQIAPTYFEQGYTLHECSVCKDSYKDNYVDKLTLPGVSGLRADTSESYVTLSWNKIVQADGYKIYTIDSQSNDLVYIGSTTSGSYTQKNLKPGSVYKYAVKGYKKVDSKEVLSKTYSSVTAVTNPKNVSGLKASSTVNSVKLNWKKAEGAAGYIVYRYNETSKKYSQIAKVTSLSYSDNKLKSAHVYKYAVKAYTANGSETKVSLKYPQVKIATNPENITKVKFSSKENSIKMSWSKVSGADGYRVYKYNSKSKKWQGVANVKGTSYTFTKLKPASSYSFTVRAYKTLDGKKYLSGKYNTFSSSTTPQKVNFTLTAQTKSVTVKWNKVTGASGYKVYYKTSPDGKWIGLKTTNKTSYTKTGLESSTTYYFTVKAYRNVNGKIYNGQYLKNKKIRTKDAVVTQQQINNFFSKAGFVGSSTGVGLKYYFQNCGAGYLGGPKMLVRGCYSLMNDTGANGSAYQISWGGYTGPARYVIKRSGIKYVFINMGANDVWESVDNVYRRYVNYLNGIRKENPNLIIYIEASTPVYASGQRGGITNKNMNALNAKMQQYCSTQDNMYFIDINTPLKNSSGSLAAQYSSDNYVHLTNSAYKVWTDTVVEFVKNQILQEIV